MTITDKMYEDGCDPEFCAISENEDAEWMLDGLVGWGKSIHIDMIECTNIRDADTLRAFFKVLCDKIDMLPYGEPVISWFGHDGKEGFTGVQLIQTSAITVHLSEADNSAYIDLFSCKDFDDVVVEAFCVETFGGFVDDSIVLQRGVNA
jgi:S-adenosylmethionine/arginine decarboxylase-like enzyme